MKFLKLLFFTLLLILLSVVCFFEYSWLQHQDDEIQFEEEEPKQIIEEEKPVESKVERDMTNFVSVHSLGIETDVWGSQYDVPKVQLSEKDKHLLVRIAMAEAEGEGVEGKALVMNVILNRLQCNEFPNTIEEIIYQKSGDCYQFTPVKSGRFDRVVPDEGCYEALDLIQQGHDNSNGALYFTSNMSDNSWHARNLEYVLTYKGHKFFK